MVQGTGKEEGAAASLGQDTVSDKVSAYFEWEQKGGKDTKTERDGSVVTLS